MDNSKLMQALSGLYEIEEKLSEQLGCTKDVIGNDQIENEQKK